MKNNKVTTEEIIELFLNTTIHEIYAENEIPRFNMLFNLDEFEIFYNVIKHPFKKEGSWTPDASIEDVQLLAYENNIYEEYPTMIVNDNKLFFQTLKNIINEYILLCDSYGIHVSSRNIAMHLMRRIWLRMGTEDFKDANDFLLRELQFIKDETLDHYRFPKLIGEIKGYNVVAKSTVNATYDETFRSMKFFISDKTGKRVYTLPHINYEIIEEDDEKVCYIYAVQKEYICKGSQDKRVERELYKLNKGINLCETHPSRVYVVLMFLNILKENDIHNIKIPTLQVLDYRYHCLMSEREIERFELKWPKEKLDGYESWEQSLKDEYEYELTFYNNVVGKQDIISQNRTKGLFSLMDRVLLHDTDLEREEQEEKSITLNFTLRN